MKDDADTDSVDFAAIIIIILVVRSQVALIIYHYTIVISWANSSSLPPYMTTKCNTFLLLESFTWTSAPSRIKLATVLHPDLLAAKSNGDLLSLSRAFMSAPWKNILTYNHVFSRNVYVRDFRIYLFYEILYDFRSIKHSGTMQWCHFLYVART